MSTLMFDARPAPPRPWSTVTAATTAHHRATSAAPAAGAADLAACARGICPQHAQAWQAVREAAHAQATQLRTAARRQAGQRLWLVLAGLGAWAVG